MPLFRGYFNDNGGEEQVAEFDLGGLLGTVLDPIGIFHGGGPGGGGLVGVFSAVTSSPRRRFHPRRWAAAVSTPAP